MFGRKPVVTIVDYGMGNLRSVQKAFERCGARALLTSEPADIRAAEKIILPGVGAFTQASEELRLRGLFEPIREKILWGTPYLGLCLGLQLLFEGSEEGRGKGFGIIRGRVKRFRHKLKVPHMGWNSLEARQKNSPLLAGAKKDERYYFVHSFYGCPKDESWVLTETDYGGRFCSAVAKENVFATQFHPEKSQEAGLRIIKNFVKYLSVRS